MALEGDASEKVGDTAEEADDCPGVMLMGPTGEVPWIEGEADFVMPVEGIELSERRGPELEAETGWEALDARTDPEGDGILLKSLAAGVPLEDKYERIEPEG